MSKKLSRVFLLTAILIVSLCMSAFVAITQTRTVSAANADFTMVDGAALRISDDDGGIRFRVKMNAATANKFKNGDAELKIAIAPKAIFATVTDGNYAELSQKIELTADKNKIYQDGEYYYANGVITNILEANRKLDFCAVAYYTEGNNTVYAAFNADVTCGSVYDIVNQLVVSYGDTYAEDILACKSYAWYGVGDYPITINTVEQYNALAAQINNGRDFSKYTALIADEVKSASGKTEITKPQNSFVVDRTIVGENVDDCILKTDCSEGIDGFTEETGSVAPGFEKKYVKTVTGEFTSHYSHKDIGKYNKVNFAIRTNANYRFNNFGATADSRVYPAAYTGWTYWELTKVADKKWNVKIYYGDTVVFDYTHDSCADNTICHILYHGVSGGDFMIYPNDNSVPYTVECTEVRGEIDNRYNTNSAKWTESHWFESENTENYMVKDGQTEYTVVIPSAPSEMINYAKEELNAFFLKQRG